MSKFTKRATVYFEPEVYSALELKALMSNSSISDLVNDAVRQVLREDQEDLKAVKERINEETISYDALLKKLKENGKI